MVEIRQRFDVVVELEHSNEFERGLSRAEGILRSRDVILCTLVASRL